MPLNALGRLVICGVLALAAGCGSSGKKSDARDGASETAAGDAPAVETATEAPDADAGTDGDAADGATADASDGGAADADAAADAPAARRYHAIAIAAGSRHSCALLEDHRIKCWGAGAFGQLGLGDASQRGAVAAEMGNALPTVDLGAGRTAKAVAAGRDGTCALLDDDSVKCWGAGSLSGKPWPADGGVPNNVGDEPNEMGDNLAPLPVGAGRKAVAVGMSYYTGCFARDDRTFRCWGTSDAPADLAAPTDGTKVARMFNGRLVTALFDDGSVHELGPAIGPSVVPRDAGTVTAAGGSSAGGCALVAASPAACWGALKPSSVPAELAGGRALAYDGQITEACGLRADGVVRCWSFNTLNVDTAPSGLVTIDVGAPVTSLASGNGQWCALTDAGDVKCWNPHVPNDPAVGAAAHTATRWDPVDLGERP
jgi:hypothetical protein